MACAVMKFEQRRDSAGNRAKWVDPQETSTAGWDIRLWDALHPKAVHEVMLEATASG